jgi:ribonuclease P/MRP protein subunit POP8
MSSNPPNPDAMDIDTTPQTNPKPTSKTLTLTSATLSHPPFAYAHLALAPTADGPHPPLPLDALQVRSYLTAALRQFLGATGAAIPLDILLVQDRSVWVRMPQPDLAAFAAAVTAFSGLSSSTMAGGAMLLQLKACGDWLGSLIGREEEGGLWTA